MNAIRAVILSSLAVLAACSSKPTTPIKQVTPAVMRDVPSVLRGTIGSEATLLKADPILVSGYGLVVGLPGTGGGDLDEKLFATMDRQLGLMGIGKGAPGLDGTPLEGKSPGEVLRSKEVAVVVVFASVIPGAPPGANFDVYVRAASMSPDISLEGGTLWSTELAVGPPTKLGGMATRRIATARGPIFINPFAEPGVREGYSRRDGRVLGGGTVVNPLDLEILLDNESYSRATLVTRAINNRFPPVTGGEPTARGRSSRMINVTVPEAYRTRAQEFLELLSHIQIDTSSPQEYARKYVEALKTTPYLGNELSWALQALPQKAAQPFVRELYDWPEMVPRLAALRAGAGLGDPMTAPALKQLAQDAPTPIRADAIGLLGRLNAGPTVDAALREQLTSKELGVRVAAYEALIDRAEKLQMARWMQQVAALPAAVRVTMPDQGTPPEILEIAGDNIQGLRRRIISGKFILDLIPDGDPLIYVAQQGRPRIALFGANLNMRRPILVSAWSDRLMLVSDSPTDDFRMLYKTPEMMSESGDVIPGRMIQARVGSDLVSLIEFMARRSTPESPQPGLGLTYSEVVGALYALQQGGATDADFAVENDVLRARLLAAANANLTTERPETPADAEKLRVYNAVTTQGQPPAPKPATDKPDLVVPLEPPVKKKN